MPTSRFPLVLIAATFSLAGPVSAQVCDADPAVINAHERGLILPTGDFKSCSIHEEPASAAEPAVDAEPTPAKAAAHNDGLKQYIRAWTARIHAAYTALTRWWSQFLHPAGRALWNQQ